MHPDSNGQSHQNKDRELSQIDENVRPVEPGHTLPQSVDRVGEGKENIGVLKEGRQKLDGSREKVNPVTAQTAQKRKG